MFNEGQKPKRLKLRKRNKSQPEVYKRKFVTRLTCPRYMGGWTKPKQILDEIAKAVLHGKENRKVKAFYAYVAGVLKEHGNKGNAALEWAWHRYRDYNEPLSSSEVMAAVDNGAVSHWYEGLRKVRRLKRIRVVDTASGKPPKPPQFKERHEDRWRRIRLNRTDDNAIVGRFNKAMAVRQERDRKINEALEKLKQEVGQ